LHIMTWPFGNVLNQGFRIVVVKILVVPSIAFIVVRSTLE
jgi:hypothetical protein